MNEIYLRFLNRNDLFSKTDSCASSPPSWRKRVTTNFGFAILLFSLLLNTGFGFAQAINATTYPFVASSGAALEDMSTGTTALVGTGSDDGASTVQNIGFEFWFVGIKYTQFSANANGLIRLGAVGVTTAWTNNLALATNVPQLAVYWDDLATGTNGGVKYKIVGAAPNRILVVDWLVTIPRITTGTAGANFQAWLYESAGVIEYRYGAGMVVNATNSGASVGFGSSATVFSSVTLNATSTDATVAYGTANNVNTIGITAGTKFMFTPASIVLGDVANLTFSAVTQNGTTLNWDDNATNEAGFLVTRATDAAFTQNVSNFSVASTTSVGTGTAYTSVQTGLSAGTNYFYRVAAVVEAGQSIGINGNQASLAGATYFWTGATDGLWNTFTNWNTAADGTGTSPTAWTDSDTHVIDGEGTAPGGALAISIDRTSFTVGQILITSNTNLTLASSATLTRTITISGGPNQDFILENGSTLNLTNATNAVAFAFSGSGNTGTISGTHVASGSTSNTINTSGGSGTLVTVTSTGNITSNLNSSSGSISGNGTSLLFENGSNWTHQNSTTINYIPNATWQPNATATLNGNTTGTSLTSLSVSLGNLIVNNILSTATLSAFTFNVRTIQGNLTVNNTGTGRFRAVTSGFLTINGNLLINAGTFEVGSSTGTLIVKGNTSVALGAVLDINRARLVNEGNMVNDGSVLSSETTTATSTITFLGTTVAQSFSGTGSFTGRVSSLGISNPLGLTVSTPVLVQRVNLFSGLITGSSNITIGTGLAIGAAVQIGQDANTTSGGSFDGSPLFDLGTGSYALLYLGETTPRITGFEVPATRSINTLILDNTNGLTLAGGTLEVLDGLTLTNGIVTSTLANHIIHGSATLAGTLTGGSNTSYVDGPIVRTINDANVATNYVLFPVGKAGEYAPISIAPTTTSVSKFRAEAFGTNAGTSDPSIIGLSATRRWEAIDASGAFTDINVILADANLVATNIPVQAPTADGAYSNAFGSTATFAAGPPITVTSTTPVASANYTGFLSYANSGACSGTPAPGNTITSSNAICFGAGVILSLQNTTAGSGVTYQWQSSADGVTFADIMGATSSTFGTTPTTAAFYRANVTCTAGPATGTSTAVQVTFANSVASTTPATRCGLGTVTLAATPSAGATINWYATATSGAILASGNSFTTPAISTTTDYFASAATTAVGNATLGAGATVGTAAGSSFLPGGWGGTKTQYIIRASELAAAGIASGAITSLGFQATTSGQAYQGFAVEIGATTQTVATGIFISGLTQVYRGTGADDAFTAVANALNTLSFGTGIGSANSFIWDGTSNIVVSISWSVIPAAVNATGSGMSVDAATFTSTNWRQRDNITPAVMQAETLASSGTGTSRPSFTINGVILCNSPRVAVEATVNNPPVLTLSATTASICAGASSPAVTITTGAADYDTYVWSPLTGVSGNSASGWLFNPAATATYTLTASQSAGNLCAVTAVFDVVVNPIPAALAFTTTVTEACLDAVVPITVSGGTLSNVTILSENFNGATNNWTTVNASTGTSPAAIAWTLRNSPFNSFISNDASQFYLSDNDAGGSGSTANTALVSPSFSTVNFVSSNVSFWHYFRSGGSAKVEYSIDNGTIWNMLETFTVTTGAINGFVQQDIALPAAALNQANVQIRFKYDTTGWEWYWAIDNVSVTGNQTTTIIWSPVSNLFTDADGTVPYVDNTNASTVYFKSATAGVNNYTATATTPLNCSVSATTAVTAVDCGIPYVNVQFPGTATISTCESQTFFAQVFKAGVTEGQGQGAGIAAWIGRNTTNTDPATWPESSWQVATFNVQSNNNDEYQATFGPSAVGTYYVASRFVFAPGAFVYGGYEAPPSGGGIWNGTSNISAILTVQLGVGPTASAQSFCNTGTVADLMAVGATGSTIQWYAEAMGGTALAGTTALATGDYYVSQSIDSCESMRTMVAVTVNVTDAPTASAQSFCNTGTVADLMAMGATGSTIQWYAAAMGGTALAGTAVLASGDYYASQSIDGCESTRTLVEVTVNVIATPTGTAIQDFTTGQTLANFTAVGQNIIWYSAATGGTVLPSTTILVSGTTYYASQTINGCESVTRLAVTAGVDLKLPTFEISNLRYYPNPVEGILTVAYSETIQGIQVYNMLGQMVYNKSTNASTVTLDMVNMATGTYIMEVTVNGITKNVKVIKK
jgi:hypothetical protein